MPKPRLITHQGVTLSIKDWAARLGISAVTLQARLTRHGMTTERALTADSLALRASGGHYPVVSVGGGEARREHIVVAERALGRALPPQAEVHHVDGDITNNAPGNLVICPNHAYHALLHVRAAAYAACGHYDWRRCVRCKAWDDPSNMTVSGNAAYHKACNAKHQATLRARRAANKE